MNAPTGSEMLLKSVLKMLGIKAEDILGPLNKIRETIESADARLKSVEDQLAILRAELHCVMAKSVKPPEIGNHGFDRKDERGADNFEGA